jgi:hypothetical protein
MCSLYATCVYVHTDVTAREPPGRATMGVPGPVNESTEAARRLNMCASTNLTISNANCMASSITSKYMDARGFGMYCVTIEHVPTIDLSNC